MVMLIEPLRRTHPGVARIAFQIALHMRLKWATLVLIALLLWTAESQALEPGLPSKTAVWAAAARALGSKNPDRKVRNPDYLAIKFLGPRERAILPEIPLDALDLPYPEAMAKLQDLVPVISHGFRTRAFDAALLDALHHGATQVVVLGAGYDSRGYRFEKELKGVGFFEVDAGPTQAYKIERVKEILGRVPPHVVYVPMDFTKDNLLDQLSKAGYSEHAQTFFLWEGVTFYLPEAAVNETLHFVRDHAAPNSRLAFNYTFSRDPNINNPESQYARWGEPWLFGFPESGAADYVRAEGLGVVSDVRTVQNICIATVLPKK
jgi:methyltransferase (TIGR00027 family)